MALPGMSAPRQSPTWPHGESLARQTAAPADVRLERVRIVEIAADIGERHALLVPVVVRRDVGLDLELARAERRALVLERLNDHVPSERADRVEDGVRRAISQRAGA